MRSCPDTNIDPEIQCGGGLSRYVLRCFISFEATLGKKPTTFFCILGGVILTVSHALTG